MHTNILPWDEYKCDFNIIICKEKNTEKGCPKMYIHVYDFNIKYARKI